MNIGKRRHFQKPLPYINSGRQTEFHQEMTNSTQVIDARLALAQVKTERLQAMYNYDVTLAKLLEYSGIPADFSSYAMRAGVKTESY